MTSPVKFLQAAVQARTIPHAVMLLDISHLPASNVWQWTHLNDKNLAGGRLCSSRFAGNSQAKIAI